MNTQKQVFKVLVWNTECSDASNIICSLVQTLLQLSIKDEIEDDEATIEDYVDGKMNDWDAPSVHKMYSIAEQCLHQKKNRRPDIKMVCSLSDKGFF